MSGLAAGLAPLLTRGRRRLGGLDDIGGRRLSSSKFGGSANEVRSSGRRLPPYNDLWRGHYEGGSHAPEEFYPHRPAGPPLRAAILQHHLQLPDHGPKCRAGPLLTLLFYAAARLTSLLDACKCLRDAPSHEAARLALIATLPDFAELHRRLNAAWPGTCPAPCAAGRSAWPPTWS